MLHRRRLVYHSRIVVPTDLRAVFGRRELWKSLRTSQYREARLRAALWEGKISSLFGYARMQGHQMTRNQIDALIARYSSTLEDSWDNYAIDVGELSAEIVERNTAFLRRALAKAEADLEANRLTATEYVARRMVEDEKLGWTPESAEFRLLCRRLLVERVKSIRALLELTGRLGESAALPEREAASSPLLSQVVADYIAFKQTQGRWTPKTQKQLASIFGVMIDLLGDRPIRSYTKADMRELYRLLPQFPTHANKRYPGLSAADAIAAADADGNDERLSPKSQNDYFTHIKSLWKWAAEHDYIDKSPAVVLKDVAELSAWDQRPAFSDDQLRAFFAVVDREDDPAMWWVPRLMLFAGLRTEEAAKLRPEDIYVRDGVAVVDVNRATGRLKTANADRLVPLHPAIAEGLQRYAATRPKGSNLWGLVPNAAGVYSAGLSKRLNARLDRAVPDDDKLVVYSLRHTFATRLKHADVHDSLLDELLGHKVEKLSVGRYGKRYPVDKLAEAVGRLRVPVGMPERASLGQAGV